MRSLHRSVHLEARLPACYRDTRPGRVLTRDPWVHTSRLEPLTLSPGSVYDAFYVLAYAIYAAGDRPVRGSDIARSIARLLPPGQPIDVGPTGILDAFTALGEGRNIDLDGAATRLDFDMATGNTASDFAVLCVTTDERGVADDDIESGLVWRATTRRLEGRMSCP